MNELGKRRRNCQTLLHVLCSVFTYSKHFASWWMGVGGAREREREREREKQREAYFHNTHISHAVVRQLLLFHESFCLGFRSSVLIL